jgi:hypothetical protein
MKTSVGFLMIGLLGMTVGCGSSSPGVGTGSTGTGGTQTTGTGGTGGSGGGASGGCQPFIAGDGTASWQAAGVAECATVTLATRMTSSSLDFLEIIGATFATQTSVGIGLTVSSTSGPLGGTYSCKSDAGGAYVQLTYTTGTVQDCTITVTTPGTAGGAHATGTFSGTVVVGGAAVPLTDGKFDTPVMTTGG